MGLFEGKAQIVGNQNALAPYTAENQSNSYRDVQRSAAIFSPEQTTRREPRRRRFRSATGRPGLLRVHPAAGGDLLRLPVFLQRVAASPGTNPP